MPFIAPPRTPCIDFDYDQAKEARLRALHEKKHAIAKQREAKLHQPSIDSRVHQPVPNHSYTLRQLRTIKPLELPKLVTTPSCNAFQPFREEYHYFHYPLRSGFIRPTRQLHTQTHKPIVMDSITRFEKALSSRQLFRRREDVVVNFDPDMVKLAEQMIFLEEGLRKSCSDIIHLRNEIMVTDYACRYAYYKI